LANVAIRTVTTFQPIDDLFSQLSGGQHMVVTKSILHMCQQRYYRLEKAVAVSSDSLKMQVK
jgi:hypothetical protein